jgi:uncharacterized OB-fold protein
VCSGCGGDELAPEDLGAEGVLYTYAAVHVASGRATPYTLGYVDLPSGPRVLARISAAEEELAVDQRVRLHLDVDGWAFGPVPSSPAPSGQAGA